jgi:hypothetical protein
LSTEWWAGVLFGVAVIGGMLAALAQLLGFVAPWDGNGAGVGYALGLALMLLGLAGTLWAQFAMGDSWRIGVDQDARTELGHTRAEFVAHNDVAIEIHHEGRAARFCRFNELAGVKERVESEPQMPQAIVSTSTCPAGCWVGDVRYDHGFVSHHGCAHEVSVSILRGFAAALLSGSLVRLRWLGRTDRRRRQ